MKVQEEYAVERIIQKRVLPDGKAEYFLKWKNWPSKYNSWEPEENLRCPSLIAKFLEEKEHRQKSTKDKNDDSSSNRKKPNNTKNNKKNDKIRYNVPEVCGFDKGLEAEKILGATDNDGLTFLIKWKGTTETELVPARIARYKCPHLVIKFFEKHITWHNISNNINL